MVARRGEHTREEMRELVVSAAEDLAAREGLDGIAMRRLAAAVGYAPNSIYHSVGDIDEIVLRLNARTLDRLSRSLKWHVPIGAGPVEGLDALVEGYVSFVGRHQRLWEVLTGYIRRKAAPLPDWYQAALARPLALVDDVLAPLFPDADDRRRSVAALWAALYGIVELTASGKLGAFTFDETLPLARLMVRRYIAGRAAG